MSGSLWQDHLPVFDWDFHKAPRLSSLNTKHGPRSVALELNEHCHNPQLWFLPSLTENILQETDLQSQCPMRLGPSYVRYDGRFQIAQTGGANEAQSWWIMASLNSNQPESTASIATASIALCFIWQPVSLLLQSDYISTWGKKRLGHPFF